MGHQTYDINTVESNKILAFSEGFMKLVKCIALPNLVTVH